jgi:mono/diheme cytochrome c family protein
MWKRVLLGVFLFVVVTAGGGAAWLLLRRPAQAPAADIKVPMTPERIARGRYIFESLADCAGCHSQRDFSRVAGPEVLSGRGRGNVLSEMLRGLPGTVVAPNITPDAETGIGRWTDGEKIRAIREGVDRTGRALFPMMPYTEYRLMSDDDVRAVVAFLDSLPPVRNPLPPTRLNFPVNVFIKFAPQPVGEVPAPNRADTMRYGEYLVTVGGCGDCHTQQNQGKPVAGMEFAGGQPFATTLGTVVTANITPDRDTGIGKWSEEFFLKKFTDYRQYAEQGPPPSPGPQAFTLMPWLGMSRLADEDLKAIYAYLHSLKPVRRYVETHPGAPVKSASR